MKDSVEYTVHRKHCTSLPKIGNLKYVRCRGDLNVSSLKYDVENVLLFVRNIILKYTYSNPNLVSKIKCS